MDITYIIDSLKSKAISHVCNNNGDIDISFDLDAELEYIVNVSWVESTRQKVELSFNTVSLFNERFSTLLALSKLETCKVTDLESSEATVTSPNLARDELNTIISSIKMYMAKEQMNEGYNVFAFTIN